MARCWLSFRHAVALAGFSPRPLSRTDRCRDRRAVRGPGIPVALAGVAPGALPGRALGGGAGIGPVFASRLETALPRRRAAGRHGRYDPLWAGRGSQHTLDG